jgi:hypothetical protein
MLRINKLKIEINTKNGMYGFITDFYQGLNFLASDDNTCGKSSILVAIYYCLGFEEIIGGRGEKVLTSVYKSTIDDGDTIWSVLESGAYLEISNGNEIITIYRSAKMESRDSRLITVFYCPMQDIGKVNSEFEDMYVHMPNSAINKKGFHSFLEGFLHLELPLVPATDDIPRKLYLQLIFSCMFIEQKHGWADIFSGMPILGIRESKKRVIEFVLHLDTLENERKREDLRVLEDSIKSEWDLVIKGLILESSKVDCEIIGLPLTPKILSELEIAQLHILQNDELIDDIIKSLQEKFDSLKQLKPKVIDNFDALQNELKATEETIEKINQELFKYRDALSKEDASINTLIESLETINTDLRNNKDAARLRKLGSELDNLSSIDICPTCNQSIKDTLLPNQSSMQIMSIDENVRHLDAQKEMLEFALNSHKQNKNSLYSDVQNMEEKIFSLRRLAKSIRSDIYSTNNDISESIVYKRLQIGTEIDGINNLIVILDNGKEHLARLSEKWPNYLDNKASIPSKKFTQLDEEKIKLLKSNFIQNLRVYGYKSILNLNEVDISFDTYLPSIEGFDMKFDSSASDNIRAIWAFTIALAQTSAKMDGNHPNILIFDEPAQHSIVPNDMEQFFKSIIGLGITCQVIIGITVRDEGTRQAIERLSTNACHIIQIPNQAFKKIKMGSE